MRALVEFIGCPSLKHSKINLVKTKRFSAVFRKIVCLDHVIGVLHYMACDSSGYKYESEVVHSHYNGNKGIFRYECIRGVAICVIILEMLHLKQLQSV